MQYDTGRPQIRYNAMRDSPSTSVGVALFHVTLSSLRSALALTWIVILSEAFSKEHDAHTHLVLLPGWHICQSDDVLHGL